MQAGKRRAIVMGEPEKEVPGRERAPASCAGT
jgi:hypothetical protein